MAPGAATHLISIPIRLINTYIRWLPRPTRTLSSYPDSRAFGSLDGSDILHITPDTPDDTDVHDLSLLFLNKYTSVKLVWSPLFFHELQASS